ncbi:MAG: tetratricopeptide repeat protein [Flavicella sp.]
MKTVQLLIFLCFLSASYGQTDTIVQKRVARSFVREGNTLFKEDKSAEAVVSYKKALEASGTYYKGAYNLGNALFDQKNYKEAVPQFELAAQSTEIKSEKAAAYHNLGNVHMAEKAYDKAIAAYKNSLRNNPSDDESRYNLAYAIKALKKQQDDKEKNKPPPPSEYAKRMKKKADKLVNSYRFDAALKLLDEALEKDVTVSNYKEYMQHLQDVIEIQNK